MKKKRHYVSVVFKEALFGVKTRLLLTPKKPCLQHKEALFATQRSLVCKPSELPLQENPWKRGDF